MTAARFEVSSDYILKEIIKGLEGHADCLVIFYVHLSFNSRDQILKQTLRRSIRNKDARASGVTSVDALTVESAV